MKTIHLAGGCFWGLEKYFKLIRGVVGTEVGFANGRTENPSYKEVYTDTTGYAECVKVSYDPGVLDLRDLLRFYFKAIDPTLENRQGEDVGTRYRSGIYYRTGGEKAVAEEVLAETQKSYSTALHVEVTALQNYYPAEEYHQDYLDKNPGGYCHIRPELYEFARTANGKD